MRIGFGYDVHRLVEKRKLILGGVVIPFEKGLLGHSDADVLLHAVIDALIGAVGAEGVRTKKRGKKREKREGGGGGGGGPLDPAPPAPPRGPLHLGNART